MTIRYADLWYGARTAELPTAADAQPMIASETVRQDAWARQNPRLPDDWAALPRSGTVAYYCAPSTGTTEKHNTVGTGRLQAAKLLVTKVRETT